MALIYFVRHGKAAAGFSEDPDPGLNDLGRAQAARIAPRLIAAGAELFSSPLRRARETAMPVEAGLGRAARIEPAVSEIVAPVADLTARGAWSSSPPSSRPPSSAPSTTARASTSSR